MASIPGGAADKLGNEFERLWAVRHLIEVLAGRAISVLIEPLGEDERGTEFWVQRTTTDGTGVVIEAHQCKRENASKGSWSIAELAEKNIIANAKFQLNRDPRHRFIFVSSDKAPALSDLEERAKRGDSPTAFRDHAVTTSNKLTSEFKLLCLKLELDPSQPEHLSKVHDFLRRIQVKLLDKGLARDDLEERVARWVQGNPNDIVSKLESFVSRNENMGRNLQEADIVAALPSGAKPRDLGKDRTLPLQIKELQARFNLSHPLIFRPKSPTIPGACKGQHLSSNPAMG